MYKEVLKHLRHYSIRVPEKQLRIRLESHPDYPSLIAVLDTIGEMGIESYACNGSEEELLSEGKPFLAHLNINSGSIRFFPDLKTAKKEYENFQKIWSGNVIFINPLTKQNAENPKLTNSDIKYTLILKLLWTFVLVSLFAYYIIHQYFVTGYFLISGLLGLYISWLIIEIEFGVQSTVGEKLCKLSTDSRCDAVIRSKGARLLPRLSWGDVGIIYFSSLVILAIASNFMGSGNIVLYYLSFSGAIFPVYSIYYQWKVLKKWCALCLLIVLLLFLNAIFSLFQIQYWSFPGGQTNFLLLPVLTFTVSYLTWQSLKPVFALKNANIDYQIKATHVVRNPQLFHALLSAQPYSEINDVQDDELIKYGSLNADYNIVIACNPYCSPCASAHKLIDQLCDLYPDKFQIAIRFILASVNEENSSARIVKAIIQNSINNPRTAVENWYSLMNPEKYIVHSEVNNNITEIQLRKFMEWGNQEKIYETPTFFINGRRLPAYFTWHEMIEIFNYKFKTD